MSESAESLINTDEPDCCIYLSNNLTGFEPRAVFEKEFVRVIGAGRHLQNEGSLLQARLRGIYDQDDTMFIKKDLIDLAIKWNKLDSSKEVEKGRLQKVTGDTVYAVGKKNSGENERSPWQSISDTFQTRLQGLYSQNTSANKEMDFMQLVKEWNNSGSQDKGDDLDIHNETIFVIGNDENVRDTGMSRNKTEADF